MKSSAVLAVMAVVVSLVAGDCPDGNCTESVMSFDLGAIFPFFGPVDIESDSNGVSDLSDDTIEPLPPKVNSSLPDGDVLSVNFMEVISFVDDSESPDEMNSPGFQFIFQRKNIFGNFGILDLSGKNLTGEEIAEELRRKQLVYSLVLSNSRIHGLSMSTFQPVESTLRELHMDNCTVALDAFYRLTNLRFLNLSNTGLATFEWYPQLKDSLEVLDLSHNKLAEVRPELSVLTSLRELYLSHNWIKSVNEYPLILLPNLEVVSLTMNVLDNATFTSLQNLVQVDVDWNYLWRFGEELQLPPYRLAVKLASNPWRCDCGIMEARKSYDVQDLDILKCNTHSSYTICQDSSCARGFLPEEEGEEVANLTKDSIKHLGCTGLLDQWYLFRQGFTQLRQHEPEKLLRMELLFLLGVLFVVVCLMRSQPCSKNKFNRHSWLKIQQIPNLTCGLKKPQEVPYIKIDSPEKA